MKPKWINRTAKIFILMSATSFFYVSMMGFFSPQAVTDLVGVKLPNNDAYSSIRGVYGGVGLSLVVALVYFSITDVRKGLSFLCLLWGFYALSRIITIIAEGALGDFGNQWLMIESTFFCISSTLLYLQNKSTVPA
ncbi:MAG TPA: DUF4345 domain-containing protein, partial [Flavisolibacter sp.]|nr:DUF4345 domain-containing protein [Flavisolibacter sp.]